MYFHNQNYTQLLDDLKTQLESIKGITNLAIVFGSVSKNSSTVLSDIDLLIVAEQSEKMRIKDILSDFTMNSGLLIDLLFITLQDFHIWKSHPIVKTAVSDGIILWNNLKVIV